MFTHASSPIGTVPLAGEIDANTLDLRQLVPALRRIPRWNGQLDDWSVWDHSALVAAFVMERHPDAKMQALLHDAHEVVTGDIPAPVLQLAPEIQLFQQRVQRAIHQRLDIPLPEELEGMSEVIHDADMDARSLERRVIAFGPGAKIREYMRAGGLSPNVYQWYAPWQFYAPLVDHIRLAYGEDPLT